MSIFEIIMLICFGLAWPASLVKSWKSRSTGGKSLLFLFVIFFGYIAGIIHKFLNNLDGVVFLYMLNNIMVTADILLYFRNMKIEKKDIKV